MTNQQFNAKKSKLNLKIFIGEVAYRHKKDTQEMAKKNKWEKYILISLALVTYIFANGVLSIPLFAWIYPVLFLKIFDNDDLHKSWLVLGGIYAVGFVIRFSQIIGMDIWICVVVSILLALLLLFPFWAWKKRGNTFGATLVYASASVVTEFLIYAVYPILGGLSDAYTQYQNRYLIQLVSLVGIYGITFFMNWTAAMAVWIWENKTRKTEIRKYGVAYVGVALLVFIYGAVMYNFSVAGSDSIRVAGVTVPVAELLNEDEDVYSVFYTDSFTNTNLINTKRKLENITDELLTKTVQEAQAGAKMVVWSELNGAVLKEDEDILLKKASDVAKEQKIYLFVSLLVKTPREDYKENKVIVLNPLGESVFDYYKFGRSIGELCQKGDGELKYVDTEYGRMATFICSDMAFTSRVRQAGKESVDILIIPASDWEEMTAIALKTAIVRGIENGCNLVRQTNRGISIAADWKGDISAIGNYFQSDTKTMTAQVLTKGRFTVYAYIGDLFVWLCGLYLFLVFISTWSLNSRKKTS